MGNFKIGGETLPLTGIGVPREKPGKERGARGAQGGNGVKLLLCDFDGEARRGQHAGNGATVLFGGLG